MYKNAIALTMLSFSIFPAASWADTAVTIQMTGGPTFVEQGPIFVDVYLPVRPQGTLPININNLVIISTMETLIQGEGVITNLFESFDESIDQASMLDHVNHQ